MKIYMVVWTIWFLSELLLNRLMFSNIKDKPNKDKGTVHIIWLSISIAITVSIILSHQTNFYISNHYHFTHYLGLSIIILGMVIRFIAIKSLGRFFTVDITIRQNHQIKQNGLYKWLRHPSYLGSLISFIGFGVSLNNWISLICTTILILIAFIYRIQIEEKVLIEQFGKIYENYKKHTYKIIPWIY